ncbi:unnamed protein product [Vitrella brassicaformis CCMP3155]|uniref:Kinesin motor domain-containing protein n=2 Tax=Vitrella brassicaformis TaxID=1169539 RepID=A0A0G4GZ42_VITBC|nr:unnamed protein product [Vitrella brassicaformis CCMP3155]|eukprot:CEM36340.1 unnamed protein product [Vitrella brassicaformis CCMP3155]
MKLTGSSEPIEAPLRLTACAIHPCSVLPDTKNHFSNSFAVREQPPAICFREDVRHHHPQQQKKGPARMAYRPPPPTGPPPAPKPPGRLLEGHYEYSPWAFETLVPPDTEARHDRIFNQIAEPLVRGAVLRGESGIVLSTGGTGSGKTFTQLGNSRKGQGGIVHESLARAFQLVHESSTVISISFVEIYRNRIHDLLLDTNTNNRDDRRRRGGQGATGSAPGTTSKFRCSTLLEALSLFGEGCERRHSAHLLSNPTASRGHTIFIIEFSDHDSGRSSVVSFVDMATAVVPERVEPTGTGRYKVYAKDVSKTIEESRETLSLCVRKFNDDKQQRLREELEGADEEEADHETHQERKKPFVPKSRPNSRHIILQPSPLPRDWRSKVVRRAQPAPQMVRAWDVPWTFGQVLEPALPETAPWDKTALTACLRQIFEQPETLNIALLYHIKYVSPALSESESLKYLRLFHRLQKALHFPTMPFVDPSDLFPPRPTLPPPPKPYVPKTRFRKGDDWAIADIDSPRGLAEQRVKEWNRKERERTMQTTGATFRQRGSSPSGTKDTARRRDEAPDRRQARQSTEAAAAPGHRGTTNGRTTGGIRGMGGDTTQPNASGVLQQDFQAKTAPRTRGTTTVPPAPKQNSHSVNPSPVPKQAELIRPLDKKTPPCPPKVAPTPAAATVRIVGRTSSTSPNPTSRLRCSRVGVQGPQTAPKWGIPVLTSKEDKAHQKAPFRGAEKTSAQQGAGVAKTASAKYGSALPSRAARTSGAGPGEWQILWPEKKDDSGRDTEEADVGGGQEQANLETQRQEIQPLPDHQPAQIVQRQGSDAEQEPAGHLLVLAGQEEQPVEQKEADVEVEKNAEEKEKMTAEGRHEGTEQGLTEAAQQPGPAITAADQEPAEQKEAGGMETKEEEKTGKPEERPRRSCRKEGRGFFFDDSVANSKIERPSTCDSPLRAWLASPLSIDGIGEPRRIVIEPPSPVEKARERAKRNASLHKRRAGTRDAIDVEGVEEDSTTDIIGGAVRVKRGAGKGKSWNVSPAGVQSCPQTNITTAINFTQSAIDLPDSPMTLAKGPVVAVRPKITSEFLPAKSCGVPRIPNDHRQQSPYSNATQGYGFVAASTAAPSATNFKSPRTPIFGPIAAKQAPPAPPSIDHHMWNNPIQQRVVNREVSSVLPSARLPNRSSQRETTTTTTDVLDSAEQDDLGGGVEAMVPAIRQLTVDEEEMAGAQGRRTTAEVPLRQPKAAPLRVGTIRQAFSPPGTLSRPFVPKSHGSPKMTNPKPVVRLGAGVRPAVPPTGASGHIRRLPPQHGPVPVNMYPAPARAGSPALAVTRTVICPTPTPMAVPIYTPTFMHHQAYPLFGAGAPRPPVR